MFGSTHVVQYAFLAGYKEVGLDRQLHRTFQPRLSSAKVFVKKMSFVFNNKFLFLQAFTISFCFYKLLQ